MPCGIVDAQDLMLEGADISNAYLHGDLNIPTPMRQSIDRLIGMLCQGMYANSTRHFMELSRQAKYGVHSLKIHSNLLVSRTPTTRLYLVIKSRDRIFYHCYRSWPLGFGVEFTSTTRKVENKSIHEPRRETIRQTHFIYWMENKTTTWSHRRQSERYCCL